MAAHRPPYGDGNSISGYNLFVSAYHGFAQLGDERVPVPRRFEGGRYSVWISLGLRRCRCLMWS